MNLEEITTWRYQNSVYVEHCLNPAVAENLDWLIAEVERQRLIISGKTQCDERQSAAMECAAIADKFHWTETTEGGGVIADAIRKEYGL